MTDIFHRLQDKNLTRLCQHNVSVFRKKRLDEAFQQPLSVRINTNWYINLFSQVEKEVEALLENQDVNSAVKRFNQALELLDYEGIPSEKHVNAFNRIFCSITSFIVKKKGDTE